jgi:hypothetical protein
METTLLVAAVAPEIMVTVAGLVVLAATIVLLITGVPLGGDAEEEKAIPSKEARLTRV